MDITLVGSRRRCRRVEGRPSLKVYNPIGMVHGAFAATLLDSASGCAVHSKVLSTQSYTTLELNTAYHKAITAEIGMMRAEGRMLAIGWGVASAEASLSDAGGRLYASATPTRLVMDRDTP